jgi:hypothetical protein
MANAGASFVRFLAEGPLTFGSECYMPEKFLKNLYHRFCTTNDIEAEKWNPETAAFAARQITRSQERRKRIYPRAMGQTVTRKGRRITQQVSTISNRLYRVERNYVFGVDFNFQPAAGIRDMEDFHFDAQPEVPAPPPPPQPGCTISLSPNKQQIISTFIYVH